MRHKEAGGICETVLVYLANTHYRQRYGACDGACDSACNSACDGGNYNQQTEVEMLLLQGAHCKRTNRCGNFKQLKLLQVKGTTIPWSHRAVHKNRLRTVHTNTTEWVFC